MMIWRTVQVGGHKKRFKIEPEFWKELGLIARSFSVSISELVAAIDEKSENERLASSIRLFVFDHRRARSESRKH